MQITLSYGTEKLRSEYPDSAPVSVTMALQALRDVRPAEFARWCDDQGYIRRSLGVFVNSEHVRYLNGLDTELRDGDEIYVIPVITGG